MSDALLLWVWHNSKMRGTRLVVHLAIGGLANRDEGYRIWAGTDYLAEHANCSRATVKRVIGELVDAGELEVLEDGKETGIPSVYRFLPGLAHDEPAGGSERAGNSFRARGRISNSVAHKEPPSEPPQVRVPFTPDLDLGPKTRNPETGRPISERGKPRIVRGDTDGNERA